jgi:hypothetical protein
MVADPSYHRYSSSHSKCHPERSRGISRNDGKRLIETTTLAPKARTNLSVIQSAAKDPTQWRDITTVYATATHTGYPLLNNQVVLDAKTILDLAAQHIHVTPDQQRSTARHNSSNTARSGDAARSSDSALLPFLVTFWASKK